MIDVDISARVVREWEIAAAQPHDDRHGDNDDMTLI